MKTCKDCIHDKVCEVWAEEMGILFPRDVLCYEFKDKSLVLDLPCKVGSKIYQLDSAGEIYESEITTIIFDTNDIAFALNAIGKNVFLSRESAEQALKERADK